MENSPPESSGFPDTPISTPASYLCIKNESRHSSTSPEAMSMGAPSPPGASGPRQSTSNKPKSKPRSIANMTQEQRDRKRENDRVAQRAIRRKTKHRITELEAIIDQLKNSDHHKELQAAIEAKQAAEAQNAEIKTQLASIVATLHELVVPRQTVAEEHAYASPASQAYVATPRPLPGPSSNMASTPTSVTSPSAAFDGHSRSSAQQDAAATLSVNQHVQALMRQREGIQRGLEIGNDRIDLGFLVTRPSSIPSYLTTNPGGGAEATGSSIPAGGGSAGLNQRPYPHYTPSTQHHYDVQVERPPVQHAPNPSQHHLPTPQTLMTSMNLSQHRPRPTMSPYGPETYPTPQQEQPAWAASLLNVEASTMLDNILLRFLKERRDLLAQGQSPAEVIGPRYPSVSSLLNKDPTSVHPLTSIFTSIINTFPDIKHLPERLATVYVMFLTMRWQVEPTRENYDHLIPALRPLPLQRTIPHPAWVDHLPFPRMREKMIRNLRDYPLDDVFVPYSKTLSVNWPYDDYHVLIQSPDTGEITINPVFDLHVRNADNWSLGEEFRVRFPDLDGTYMYRDVTGSRAGRG